jgi:hypothetical protein
MEDLRHDGALSGSQTGSQQLPHPDADGEWSPAEAMALSGELQIIEAEFAALPARGFAAGSGQDGR